MMSTGHYWTYFDIETTGINEDTEKIITIQFQNLVYDEDGKPRHDAGAQDWIAPGLHILKEWESDEKTILQQAYDKLLVPQHRKYFEPIGNNLSFEGKFLKSKLTRYGILGQNEHLRFGQLKMIDLLPVVKLINGGDSSTAKFFGKVGYNAEVPNWYAHKQYDKIEKYINEETRSFIKTMDRLMLKLPELRNEILALHA